VKSEGLGVPVIVVIVVVVVSVVGGIGGYFVLTSPKAPTGGAGNQAGENKAENQGESVPTPAIFEVSNLTSNPSEVNVGEPVVISATVKNNGDLEDNYTAVLKIDGETENTKNVTLAGGAAETVSFTVVKSVAKTYDVEIDGSTTSFSVVTPDFEISSNSASKSISQSSSGTITITVTSVGGFNSPVSLSVSGLPSGASTSFSSTSVSPTSNGQTSTLTITVGSTVSTGTYALTITGTSGSLSHSTTVSLTVTTSPDVEVKVIYDGSWSGSLGELYSSSHNWSVDGSGTKSYYLNNPDDYDMYIVSALFQKKDGSSKTLTAEIIWKGTTYESQSTSAAYGIASVSKSWSSYS
jgi:hypothetical protein